MTQRRPLLQQRRWRRGEPQPLLHFVPNMFTILGLCLGLTGMRYALDERWQLAVGLLVLAAVVDGLDGRSARMLKVTSTLGAQLDSLADFVSFGVAPAVIVYLWVLNDVRGVGWAIAMLFATCCALRLARFNSELDTERKPRWQLYFFKGLPAPAAAGLVLMPAMVSFAADLVLLRSWPLNALVMVGVALLMISTVPTVSLKRVRVTPDQALPLLLGVGIAIVFLVTEPWLTLSLVGLVYALSIPFGVRAARRMALRGAQPASASDEAPDAAAPTDDAAPRETDDAAPLEEADAPLNEHQESPEYTKPAAHEKRVLRIDRRRS